jgi:hypothetical protein
MRLINTRTLQLEEYFGDSIPEYAILSHTWEQDEVTFQQWQQNTFARTSAGYRKITGSCDMARKHHHDYIWVDTCCIDKSSSAELTEAINSMFSWYQKSVVCYCYLVDVVNVKPGGVGNFSQSRWFTRGWTLQVRDSRTCPLSNHGDNNYLGTLSSPRGRVLFTGLDRHRHKELLVCHCR